MKKVEGTQISKEEAARTTAIVDKEHADTTRFVVVIDHGLRKNSHNDVCELRGITLWACNEEENPH
jgi:hypothetical protein